MIKAQKISQKKIREKLSEKQNQILLQIKERPSFYNEINHDYSNDLILQKTLKKYCIYGFLCRKKEYNKNTIRRQKNYYRYYITEYGKKVLQKNYFSIDGYFLNNILLFSPIFL